MFSERGAVIMVMEILIRKYVDAFRKLSLENMYMFSQLIKFASQLISPLTNLSATIVFNV